MKIEKEKMSNFWFPDTKERRGVCVFGGVGGGAGSEHSHWSTVKHQH